MKYLFLIFLLFIACQISGQNSGTTKKQIESVFAKSISQKEKGHVLIPSNEWTICNSDSAYYKSDTINLYSSHKDPVFKDCCDFIGWTFYKKRAFVLSAGQTCREPTWWRVTRREDWFRIQIIDKGGTIFLKLVDLDQREFNYKILSLTKLEGDNSNSDYWQLSIVRLTINS